jgi:hypothetical protein
MGSLRHWYKGTPFWEGVASAFDLFGVTGISITDLKEIVSEKRRYEAIKENYDLARKDLESQLEKYEREFKKSKKISG